MRENVVVKIEMKMMRKIEEKKGVEVDMGIREKKEMV